MTDARQSWQRLKRGLLLGGTALAVLCTTSFFVPTEGLIVGYVHYPACHPPDDLVVCAEQEGGEDRICTGVFVPTPEGQTYSLAVPPGRWLVYAEAPTDIPGRRAYYSRAVTCGLSIHCSDHRPISVQVKAGGLVEGVDPDDWFDEQPPGKPPLTEQPDRPMS